MAPETAPAVEPDPVTVTAARQAGVADLAEAVDIIAEEVFFKFGSPEQSRAAAANAVYALTGRGGFLFYRVEIPEGSDDALD